MHALPTRTKTAAVGAAALTVLALAGCTKSSNASPAPHTTTPTTAASSPDRTSNAAPTTSSPAPRTTASTAPDEVARQQAAALVRKYQRVLDQAYQDPSREAAQLDTVAMDQELTNQIRGVNLLVESGGRQYGHSRVVTLAPGFVSLQYKPHATPRILPTVRVTACVDVRRIKAVDAHGHSITPADRPPFYIETLTVQNFRYPDASTWRVVSAPNRGAKSCVGV